MSVRAALLIAALATAAPSAAQDAARTFHLGFTPLPPVYSPLGHGVVYTYLQREADLVSHSFQDGVPWPEALRSTDWRTYPAGVRQTWSSIAAADGYFLPGHARYVAIHAINYAYNGPAEYWGERSSMALPPPWNTYTFDHPDVRTAFLNYAIAAVEFFRPTYFGLGVEANILLARAPWTWAAYKALNAYVYTELKRRYPDLIVFSTIQYEHMLGLQYESRLLADMLRESYPGVLESEVRDLLRHSDLFVLSTYPFMVRDAVAGVAHYDAALRISGETGRRIAIEQTGYTSETVQIYYSALTGSESVQAQFVATLLDLAWRHEFAFVVNYVAIDYGTNYGTDPVSMTWAYTGLWRPDGSAKPAADVWRAVFALPRVWRLSPVAP